MCKKVKWPSYVNISSSTAMRCGLIAAFVRDVRVVLWRALICCTWDRSTKVLVTLKLHFLVICWGNSFVSNKIVVPSFCWAEKGSTWRKKKLQTQTCGMRVGFLRLLTEAWALNYKWQYYTHGLWCHRRKTFSAWDMSRLHKKELHPLSWLSDFCRVIICPHPFLVVSGSCLYFFSYFWWKKLRKHFSLSWAF